MKMKNIWREISYHELQMYKFFKVIYTFMFRTIDGTFSVLLRKKY